MIYGLITLTGIAVFLWLFVTIGGLYDNYDKEEKMKRQTTWTLRRRIKCLFGFHAPDTVKAEVGGRNVQRCLYCDKVVREYQVTKEGAKKNPVIRRIY